MKLQRDWTRKDFEEVMGAFSLLMMIMVNDRKKIYFFSKILLYLVLVYKKAGLIMLS